MIEIVNQVGEPTNGRFDVIRGGRFVLKVTTWLDGTGAQQIRAKPWSADAKAKAPALAEESAKKGHPWGWDELHQWAIQVVLDHPTLDGSISGIELKARREALGTSVTELSRATDWTQPRISEAEAGKPRRVPDHVEAWLSQHEAVARDITAKAIDSAMARWEENPDLPLVLSVQDHLRPDVPEAVVRVGLARARDQLKTSGLNVRIEA
jgi:hypothetical protein